MANSTQKNPAAVWQQRFENRRNKLRRMFEDARKYYDILYATQSNKGMSPWKSKVYVPVLASKAWDLIARMSDVVPLFNVELKNSLILNDETGQFEKDPAVLQQEQRIQAKLQQDYNCGDEPIKMKVFDPLVDAVAAGTGYAYANWVMKKDVHKSRKQMNSGIMDNNNITVKKTSKGKNNFEGVNFYNVFPADGPSFQRVPYLIVRGYKSKVDMKKAGLYINLEKVNTETTNLGDFKLNNESRNRVVNEEESTWQDSSVGIVTYYECYERTEKGIELTVYAEGESEAGNNTSWVTIRESSYPYWHDSYPLVPFYVRRKSFSPFGESLFENNRTLQSATNDLFNHYLDNWNLSIDSMLMYEDGTLTNDFVVEPGGEITFTGEKPTQFKFPEPNPQQLSVVMGVLDKGIEAATFSGYASGNPNSSTDKTQGTAYGVKTITEAATNKIGFFRDNFKQSMKLIGNIWLSNLRQFENDPQQVSRTVNGRPQPDIVMPTDYQEEGIVDIDDDSMTPLSKQDKIDSHDRFVQSSIVLQKAAMEQATVFGTPADVPRFNYLEFFDDGARLHSVKNVERYLLDQTVEPPKPQPVPIPFKETKEGIVLDSIAKKVDKMQPDIQAELEVLAGLQPSAMHDSTLAHNAIKMGAEQAQIEDGGQHGIEKPGNTGAPTVGNTGGGTVL